MGVGDINSTERGSGARFNDGKTPTQFLLLQMYLHHAASKLQPPEVQDLIVTLAAWECHRVPWRAVMAQVGVHELAAAAWVFEYGAGKYAAWNWAKGMPYSIPMACIKRHYAEMLQGQATDSESGQFHWGHIICNVLMIDHFEYEFDSAELDDRPPEYIFDRVQAGEPSES